MSNSAYLDKYQFIKGYFGVEPERVDVIHLESDIPQTIMRKGFHNRGRPRVVPLDPLRPDELKVILNKPIKEFSYLERKSYNRLASRRTYAKEKIIALECQTASQYKQKLGKKIKDFNKTEKIEYNRLSKIEERIENNLST